MLANLVFLSRFAFHSNIIPYRTYNFASQKYCGCFKTQTPTLDLNTLRTSAVDYLKNFNVQRWYDDPICTILKGSSLKEGKEITTVNAFNEENGKLILSTSVIVDKIIHHMKNYKPPKKDYRDQIRKLETEFFTDYVSELISNQAVDFKKQDGISEIEEAVQTNPIEQNMNDLLYQDELDGVVEIGRHPALVGCVSNFSNFLDLCRKVLRNIELGIPVVVLSRTNTSQHMFRWTQILLKLMQKHHVDLGMVTFAACDVHEQRRIMSAFPESPLYFTGSRDIAAAIKEVCPKLVASTGGPNTMVVTTVTPSIAKAVRTSVAIENSGQCTALRHVVVPPCTDEEVANIFEGLPKITSPVEALEKKEFAAIFANQKFKLEKGYTAHPSGLPVAYRIGDEFPSSLNEFWRRLYLDVTKVPDFNKQEFVDKLSTWLIHEQPISLVVNSESYKEAFQLTKKLFEKTSMVVYTIGTSESPALTAQARPQDAEVFGEFPPRHLIHKFTKFPVVVPTATPSYNTVYNKNYLTKMAKEHLPPQLVYMSDFLDEVKEPNYRGYIILLLHYLTESCTPKQGGSARTALWGLQRPPLGSHSEIRCGKDTEYDPMAVYFVSLYATNARETLSVSCDPQNEKICRLAKKFEGINFNVETDEQFKKRIQKSDPWNVINPTKFVEFPMVGQFISLLLPLGHIKSTRKNDLEFVDFFKKSEKWLSLREK